MTPFQSSLVKNPLQGTVRVPGDKSISHRAVMFGGLAQGVTRINGLLQGDDVKATLAALVAMGARTWHDGDTICMEGVGEKGLQQPAQPLDMGNSGTSTRLLMGIIAGYPVTVAMHGDASLSKRPMKRVMTPLATMGAKFSGDIDGRLPMTVHGTNQLQAIQYTLPMASAQVKSAVLLAGLRAQGTTTVIEPEATRDHTERMLQGFGVKVVVEGNQIHITGGQQLVAPKEPIQVPADPSSAAFPLVAACIIGGSTVCLKDVCLNPTRTGLLLTLQEMGADISCDNVRIMAGETIGDIIVHGGKPLRAVTVPAARAASMIDEYPILAVAAALAHGASRFEGLGELRVKESDRLHAVAEGLKACGVTTREGDDWLEVDGLNGASPAGGCTIKTELDHRLAMAFLVMGAVTQNPVRIDDITPVSTSFPTFVPLMQGVGLNLG